MSGRGGRGIGIGFCVIDDADMSDDVDMSDIDDNMSDIDDNMSDDVDMNDLSLIECPTCRQPLNLTSEVAQFRAKLADQCCDCCCGSCGQRKKPGIVCCN